LDKTPACEVWFYHLERSGLDQVLPELLEKTLQKGWRALVRGGDAERLEHLDSWLWTFKEDGFLPHGLGGEPFADHQPVLLTTADDNPNAAQALFLIDGAQPGDLGGYERCLVLFDGRDEAALAAARVLWKSVKGLGLPASYWRQGERRGWEKQA
jgi:DNA polymerase-3 subunit chi